MMFVFTIFVVFLLVIATSDESASLGIWISESGCGTRKGCVLWPQYCRGLGCEIIFSFEETEAKDYIHFELQAKTSGWVAVGFSYDMHMGHDDVYACVNVNGTVRLHRSYNQAHANVPRKLYGISHQEGSYAEGYTSCRFTRTKAVTQLDVNMFGFYQSWYIILPYGNVDPNTGKMLKHDIMPVVTSERMLLSSTEHRICPAEFAHDAQHSYLLGGGAAYTAVSDTALTFLGVSMCLNMVVHFYAV
ncbi:DOMON domain-containing protein FRRS1L-like [Saccoglossus kowalevskii]